MKIRVSGLLGCLIAIALYLCGCQSLLPQGFTAEVVQVVTGREVEVTGVAGQPEITERVQLEGVAVPDLTQQPWGEAAKNWLAHAIAHQSILVESDAEPRSPTGQRLGYLWRNGALLNEQLVAAGQALVLPHPPNDKYDDRLAQAQDRARILGLGIWNPANPLRQTPAAMQSQR